MIGVVLWRDLTAGKAVIWCDDQGDLAFFTHLGILDAFEICVGDWVTFDLELHGDFRMAKEVQVLAEPGCPDLVHNLVAENGMPIIPRNRPPNEDKADLCEESPSKVCDSIDADLSVNPRADDVPPVSAAAQKRPAAVDRSSDGQGGKVTAVSGSAENVIAFPLALARKRRWA